MLTVYSYNEETKEYNGTTVAQVDPRASKAAGVYVYIMPANSTKIKPPSADKYQAALFNGNGWDIVADYRNETVYNLMTREPMTIKEFGPIPTGYTLELPERLEEIKASYLFNMKAFFEAYLREYKLDINGNQFCYSSLERLTKERDNDIIVSRDDNNNIYTFSKDNYENVINYLGVFGQLAYLKKWQLEQELLVCTDLDILKGYKNKLNIQVSDEEVEKLVALTPTKRKNYFIKLANNIK